MAARPKAVPKEGQYKVEAGTGPGEFVQYVNPKVYEFAEIRETAGFYRPSFLRYTV